MLYWTCNYSINPSRYYQNLSETSCFKKYHLLFEHFYFSNILNLFCLRFHLEVYNHFLDFFIKRVFMILIANSACMKEDFDAKHSFHLEKHFTLFLENFRIPLGATGVLISFTLFRSF
jgi:hypothetical protein